jgi:hypothetical protein
MRLATQKRNLTQDLVKTAAPDQNSKLDLRSLFFDSGISNSICDRRSLIQESQTRFAIAVL